MKKKNKAIEYNITDLLGCLESASNAAFILRDLGFIPEDVYRYEFDNKIAMMEQRIRDLRGDE